MKNTKTVRQQLKRLERELLRVALEAHRAGDEPEAVKQAMDRVLKQFNLQDQLSGAMQREYEQIKARTQAELLKRHKHIVTFTSSAAESEAGIAIVEKAQSSFAQTEKGIQRDVIGAVTTAARRKLGHSAIKGILHQKMRKPMHQARTIANTATAAFQTASSMQMDAEAGVTRWRYEGPPGEREFCKSRVGKSYSMRDIKGMDNGQGLDAYLYRGGWNCRHMWVPVAINDVSFTRMRRGRKEYEQVAGEMGGKAYTPFVVGTRPAGKTLQQMHDDVENGIVEFEQVGKAYLKIHESWQREYEESLNHNSMQKRDTFEDERDTARRILQAAPSLDIVMRTDVLNKKSGPHDLTILGYGYEVFRFKRSMSLKSISTKLSKNQSNLYVFHIESDVNKGQIAKIKDRLYWTLSDRLRLHNRRISVWILEDGDPPKWYGMGT